MTLAVWRQRLIASTVVASVVVLTDLLWLPLETAASVFSVPFENPQSGSDHPLKEQLSRTAIVKIDRDQHVRRYGGRSPLDRCTLRGDIERMLSSPALKVLAIDFDLSPPAGQTGKQEECQHCLDSMLDQHGSQLILMEPGLPDLPDPSDRSGPAARRHHEAVLQWRELRAKAGIAFGHAMIQTKAGIVRSYVPSEDNSLALGYLLSQRLRQLASRPKTHRDEDAHLEVERPVALRGTELLHGKGLALTVDEICPAEGERTSCAPLMAVIFGSGYSADDRFETLAAPRDGVDIHAAIAACPEAGLDHATLFWLEILFGAVVCAPVFTWLWNRYYESATRGRPDDPAAVPQNRWRAVLRKAVPGGPESAYLWFFWMAATALLLIVAVAAVSTWVTAGACSVSIFPAGIVVGMLIEVLIVQGIEVATHKLTPPSPHHGSVRWNRHTLFQYALAAGLLALALAKVHH